MLLLEIPADWDAVVPGRPGAGREWQEAVRGAFEACLSRGYVAAGFVRPATDPRAAYLLRKDEPCPAPLAAGASAS